MRGFVRDRVRNGLTLVELMITVAMLGIMAACLGTATRRVQLTGITELQHEQALLLLEYHADCTINNTRPDRNTLDRLTRTLPGAEVHRVREGGVVTLVANWRDALGGPAIRSLTVFSP